MGNSGTIKTNATLFFASFCIKYIMKQKNSNFTVVQLLSFVWLFATPWTAALQAPLSVGFSRQENWSRLPCPPPGDLPHPRIELRSPALQGDSLPAEPPGKPKNTGVGSLFLLQVNFPNQKSNWGLLHCRRIIYQLTCQGSPDKAIPIRKYA